MCYCVVNLGLPIKLNAMLRIRKLSERPDQPNSRIHRKAMHTPHVTWLWPDGVCCDVCPAFNVAVCPQSGCRILGYLPGFFTPRSRGSGLLACLSGLGALWPRRLARMPHLVVDRTCPLPLNRLVDSPWLSVVPVLFASGKCGWFAVGHYSDQSKTTRHDSPHNALSSYVETNYQKFKQHSRQHVKGPVHLQTKQTSHRKRCRPYRATLESEDIK